MVVGKWSRGNRKEKLEINWPREIILDKSQN